MLHTINQRRGKKGAMVIKLNLKKAYDRMEWEFIADTMKDAGIPSNLTSIAMRCIKNGLCRLLWNGEVTETIGTSKGLRQGDRLSPYMFVFCLEWLSQWINAQQVIKKSWKAVKASRSRLLISRHLFADDIILFAEAREGQIRLIKEGLRSIA